MCQVGGYAARIRMELLVEHFTQVAPGHLDRETSTMAAPRNLSDLRPIPAPTAPSPQLTWSLSAGLLDQTSHCPEPQPTLSHGWGAAAPHPRQGPFTSCALTREVPLPLGRAAPGSLLSLRAAPPTSTAKRWMEKHRLCMRRDLRSARGGGGQQQGRAGEEPHMWTPDLIVKFLAAAFEKVEETGDINFTNILYVSLNSPNIHI